MQISRWFRWLVGVVVALLVVGVMGLAWAEARTVKPVIKVFVLSPQTVSVECTQDAQTPHIVNTFGNSVVIACRAVVADVGQESIHGRN